MPQDVAWNKVLGLAAASPVLGSCVSLPDELPLERFLNGLNLNTEGLLDGVPVFDSCDSSLTVTAGLGYPSTIVV